MRVEVAIGREGAETSTRTGGGAGKGGRHRDRSFDVSVEFLPRLIVFERWTERTLERQRKQIVV